MTDSFSEAPFSLNMKPGPEYDAPGLTIRAETAESLHNRTSEAENSPLFGTIVDAHAAFKARWLLSTKLGATTVETQVAPQEAPQQPPAQQAGFAPAPAWGQPQAAAAPQGYAQPPAAPAPAGAASAGAPFIPAFGMPATFRSGQGAKGPWSAYFDPRPKQVTDAIQPDYTGKVPSTDDPNHPGLAGGTHKFAKFLR